MLILFLLNAVALLFILFITSWIFYMISPLPFWQSHLHLFQDAIQLNPQIDPVTAAVGSVLFYFVTTALLVFTYSVAEELERKKDIYDIEGAIKASFILGTAALIAGFALRLAKLGSTSGLVIPILFSAHLLRKNWKRGIVAFFTVTAALWANYVYAIHTQGNPWFYYISILLGVPALAILLTKIE